MIDAHGFNANLYDANGTAGNQIMLRLVIEGMKLQPCSPGFVDGRNAIIAADARSTAASTRGRSGRPSPGAGWASA